MVLGLIFLKYVSDTFNAQQRKLQAEFTDPNSETYLDPDIFSPEDIALAIDDPDAYAQDNVVYVPQQARWDEIKSVIAFNRGDELPWLDKNGQKAKFNGASQLIDSAFEAIEQENDKFKGLLHRISQYELDDPTLIGLVNLFSDTEFTANSELMLAAKDILGHVYEYFLGEFALAEGYQGGQYFTPKSIVSLIVEMLQPYSGRIYDPAMGSGGFFVQTDRFIAEHQGRRDGISIYGQESNATTYKLAAINMIIRNIDFQFANGDTLVNPKHIDTKMDFVMANPPFNQDEWWNESLTDDPRWKYGTPPQGNGNFAWLQHMIYHLKDTGRMALLLANGSMSSQTNNEGSIRQGIVKADLVEAMIALPDKLFTNTGIPACIWIINKAKKRKGEVLFLDARNFGFMKSRKQRDFTAEDIQNLALTYHNWQQSKDYDNIPAYCYSASLSEIADNDFVLTPGRYVGAIEAEDDGIPFAEKMQNLTALLKEQFEKGAELEAKIKRSLGELGYAI